MNKDYSCPVIQNERLAEKIFRLRFHSPVIASTAQPGQFINIRVTDGYKPFWRRPISIHRINQDEGWVELLIGIVGNGTQLLAGYQDKETLRFLGPLGNAFSIPDNMEKAIIIAGGLGIAPMLFLTQTLINKHIPVEIYYGANTKENLCCLEEFHKLGANVHFSTDDGTMGFKGFVPDLLMNDLKSKQFSGDRTVVFTCGPLPMLARVQAICREFNLPGQVSIETVMACGFGACMGCNVPVKKEKFDGRKYVLACKDGPVFPIGDILLNG